MLQSLFSANANAPAIWISSSCISYGSLQKKINLLASEFRAQGINSSHRVAFLAKTNLNSILIFFALLQVGASPCPLSPRIPQETIFSYLDRARASFFIDNQTLNIEKRKEEFLFEKSSILLFTSGSSSFPKLALLNIDLFIASAKSSIPLLELSNQTSCWLLSVPLFHVSGLSILFRCFLSKNSIALSDNFLEGHPLVTHLSLVPTQLFRLVHQNVFSPLLKCALIGGAPITKTLVKLSLKQKIPIRLTYGMTETASQITMTRPLDLLLPPHCGKVLPGKEVQLSEEGEILVRGDSLFLGYDTPLGIDQKLNADGWFATGDLGAWGYDSNLEHRGRKDRLFISGGENIYPEVIERALGTLPDVIQSIVIPIEDSEFGQRPVAFVLMQDTMPSKEEFYEKLSSLIPRFSFPIRFLPFPLTEGLKPKRNDLLKYCSNLVR